MDLNKTRVTHVNSTASIALVGDGSTVPRLEIKLFSGDCWAYVEPSELLKLGNTLTKWGKKLKKVEDENQYS